jgi:hypothetical protein
MRALGAVKTYLILRENGSLRGFEITSTRVWFKPLFRILNSVEGVTDIRRNPLNDDRVTFRYKGVPAIVTELWGDNSRYWVGLADPDATPELDISQIHETFANYRGMTIF